MAASVESQPGTPTAAVPMGMVANGSGKKPKTPIKPVTKSKGKKRSSCGIFWSPDNEHLRCRVTAGKDLATGGCTWRCPEPKVDGKTQCAKHIAYDESKKNAKRKGGVAKPVPGIKPKPGLAKKLRQTQQPVVMKTPTKKPKAQPKTPVKKPAEKTPPAKTGKKPSAAKKLYVDPNIVEQTPDDWGWWFKDADLVSAIEAGAGDALGLVWVKTKGYPWWPAQKFPVAQYDHKIPDDCFKSQLRNVKRDDDLSDVNAYMYFGTGKTEPFQPEIILMKTAAVKDRVVSWSEGWKKGLGAVPEKGKGRKTFIMNGVWDACNMVKDVDRKPWGWFDHVLPPTPTPSPEPAPKKRKAPSAAAAATPKGTPKKAKKLTKKEEKAIAKAEEEARLAEEAAKIKWPKLTALTDFPKSDAFAPKEAEMTLPFEFRKELSKPPFYHKLNRNEWVSRTAAGFDPEGGRGAVPLQAIRRDSRRHVSD